MNTLGLVADRVIRCNVCGLEHSETNLHRDVTPLKRAQMACDALEQAGDYFQMTPIIRQSIRQLSLDLRDTLGIPREKFFENNLYEMPLAIFAEIDPQRIKTEQEQMRKSRQYAPSLEQIKKGKKVLKAWQETFEGGVAMKDLEYDVLLKILKEKKKALKLE